jgi:hypothetical protein
LRSGGIAPPFLISILDGGEWPASDPGRLTSGGSWRGKLYHMSFVYKKSIVRFLELCLIMWDAVQTILIVSDEFQGPPIFNSILQDILGRTISSILL